MPVLTTYTPQPPLAAFVESFWLCNEYILPHAKERKLPNGAMQLIFSLRDDSIQVYDGHRPEQCQRLRGCLISGVHSDFFVIDTVCQTSIMGVQFKPGGAFPFLKLPAGELHDVHVSLHDLWGQSADDLHEQLFIAHTPEDKFRILEQALLKLLARSNVPYPAVAYALNEFLAMPHTRAISDVIAQVSLSQRRFIQVFRNEVGLTPKLFCRVQRFQEALRRMRKEKCIDWTNLALSCGYFDQAHFIHDFQSFTGLTPTAYMAQKGEFANHVPFPT